MNESLSAARTALDRNELGRAAALLNDYQAATTEPLAYNRNYLQLSHELDIKQRRAAGAVRA
jgi:hypothetical protein